MAVVAVGALAPRAVAMPIVDHNAPWLEHLAELAADLRRTAIWLEAIVSTANP